jgi:hypothetical protein
MTEREERIEELKAALATATQATATAKEVSEAANLEQSRQANALSRAQQRERDALMELRRHILLSSVWSSGFVICPLPDHDAPFLLTCDLEKDFIACERPKLAFADVFDYCAERFKPLETAPIDSLPEAWKAMVDSKPTLFAIFPVNELGHYTRTDAMADYADNYGLPLIRKIKGLWWVIYLRMEDRMEEPQVYLWQPKDFQQAKMIACAIWTDRDRLPSGELGIPTGLINRKGIATEPNEAPAPKEPVKAAA